MATDKIHPLKKILENRIAILDGAMGTTIRTYGMTEKDIRGERFKDAKKDLLNNGDIFSLTQAEDDWRYSPAVSGGRCGHHRDQYVWRDEHYAERVFCRRSAGAGGRKDPEFYQKIIEDSFLNELAWDINETSARQCREWADRVGNATGRQRFVAGALGPLTVSLSNSPDAEDAGFRVVTFDQVKDAYARQVRALLAGGVDLLLVETIFDSLNAKAALVAIREVFDADAEGVAADDFGGGGARRRDDDFGADDWGVLECGGTCEAVVGGAELLAGAGPDVSVS